MKFLSFLSLLICFTVSAEHALSTSTDDKESKGTLTTDFRVDDTNSGTTSSRDSSSYTWAQASQWVANKAQSGLIKLSASIRNSSWASRTAGTVMVLLSFALWRSEKKLGEHSRLAEAADMARDQERARGFTLATRVLQEKRRGKVARVALRELLLEERNGRAADLAVHEQELVDAREAMEQELRDRGQLLLIEQQAAVEAAEGEFEARRAELVELTERQIGQFQTDADRRIKLANEVALQEIKAFEGRKNYIEQEAMRHVSHARELLEARDEEVERLRQELLEESGRVLALSSENTGLQRKARKEGLVAAQQEARILRKENEELIKKGWFARMVG